MEGEREKEGVEKAIKSPSKKKINRVRSSFLLPFFSLSKKLQQSLLRAVALFAGGVIVARNFGDAFNV